MSRSWKLIFGIAVFHLLALFDARRDLAATNELPKRSADKLVVHEWGTFTSLEDESGKSLGGINVDDEPVPPFVHQLFGSFVLGPQHSWQPADTGKGSPARHPYVTLRLETPVLYFYPPRSQKSPLTLDVGVQFRGGWLTQFYPLADAVGPKPKNLGEMDHFVLNHNTVSDLKWRDLQVGTEDDGPKTDEAVWTIPRNVAAADVTTPSGESERYLFYRGVGNVDSPISVASDSKTGMLSLRPRFEEVLPAGESDEIRWLWLVKIKAEGATAYRRLPPLRVTSDPKAATAVVRGTFDPTDFATENLGDLLHEMHSALVAEGLFDDEATAMLKTWEKSYFRSGGWRLFFVVPRCWTDHYLPLTISQPADVTRVMIGRTELISPEQRELMTRLAISQISSPSWVKAVPDTLAGQKFRSGRSDFGDLGVKIPPDYQLYLDLGRFRNALILDEQSRRGTPAIAQFIKNYDLRMFRGSDRD